jgi:hypothetical protein
MMGYCTSGPQATVVSRQFFDNIHSALIKSVGDWVECSGQMIIVNASRNQFGVENEPASIPDSPIFLHPLRLPLADGHGRFQTR